MRGALELRGRVTGDIYGLPLPSAAGRALLYYDSDRGALRVSTNGGAYGALTAGLFVDVSDYGAKGDTRYVEDAAMTSGSATVTSASASFAAADVGKFLSVRGAGAAGATLVGTVSAVLSSTQVTASVVAGTTVSGKRVVWGTVDQTAIQTALTAVATARRGSVYFPAGVYLVNAQLEFFGASDADPIRGGTIFGDRGATLWMADVAIPYTGGLTGSVLASIYAEDITIRDLIFQGPDSDTLGPFLTVVRMTGIGSNCVMEGLTVRDFGHAIPIDFSGTGQCAIGHCFVTNCDDGIVQSNVGGRCHVHHNFVTAMRLATTTVGPVVCSGTGNTLEANYLETPSQGVAIDLLDTGTHATIVGNRIKGSNVSTCTGIRVHPNTGGYVTIQGNEISDVGVGIVANGTSHTILGNTIEGVGAGSTGIATFRSTNPGARTAIVGNVFENLQKGVDGNSLACDRILVNSNIFHSNVTTPLVSTNWTNSKGVGNIGVADF